MAVPVALVVLWGRYIAPKAAHRLHDPIRLVVEVVIFVPRLDAE